MLKYRCVIFDLDGTLVNTLEDIASSMNKALSVHDFPPVPLSEYAHKVGWGITHLAFLALPESGRDEETVRKVALSAARFYEEAPCVFSRPYPGIPALIAELQRRKVKTAVLTNKPDRVSRLVIDRLFPPESFNAVRGDRPGGERKPNPQSTWDILVMLGLTPRDAIFIGDSEIDMETARAAQCFAVGVSWGFRPRETLEKAGAARIIDSPEEALGFIGQEGF
ncbi:MAG: HAD family hydrolase [Treponema sp.]|jgi:phosphoglycolate phosphatase|nr:HAD family hydrolase [Treponema sp.]